MGLPACYTSVIASYLKLRNSMSVTTWCYWILLDVPRELRMSDKNAFCRDFVRGACTRGPRCRFQHSDDVLVTSCIIADVLTTGSKKRKLQNEDSDNVVLYCRDFQRGQCRRAPGCCRYIHGYPSNDDRPRGSEFNRHENMRQPTSPDDSDNETYRSQNNENNRAPVNASDDGWFTQRDNSYDDRREGDNDCGSTASGIQKYITKFII